MTANNRMENWKGVAAVNLSVVSGVDCIAEKTSDHRNSVVIKRGCRCDISATNLSFKKRKIRAYFKSWSLTQRSVAEQGQTVFAVYGTSCSCFRSKHANSLLVSSSILWISLVWFYMWFMRWRFLHCYLRVICYDLVTNLVIWLFQECYGGEALWLLCSEAVGVGRIQLVLLQ